MTDQSQRLEVATVKAEVGSNILYRFANDPAANAEIPTEAGDIPNLKQVILQLQEDGAEKISFATTIYPTTAAGIAATTSGAIFLVVSNEADEIYAVYTNAAGVAVDTGKRALSSQAVQDAMQAATEAADAAQDAADISTERTARFMAPVSTPPVIRDDGTPLQIGDRYVNTVDQAEYIYKTGGWALNDSLAAIADLENASDPAKGASLIPYDGTTAGEQMLKGRKLASYDDVRSYTGMATNFEITNQFVHGFFAVDTSDTTSADDGGAILLDGSGRRVKRQIGGNIQAAWFGVLAGVSSDAAALANSLAINAACDFAGTIGGGVVELPAGTILLANTNLAPLNWDNRRAVYIRYNSVSLKGRGVGRTILKLAANSNCHVIKIGSRVEQQVMNTNCGIYDLEIDGNRLNQLIPTETENHSNGIDISTGCSSTLLHRLSVHDCAYYGIGFQRDQFKNCEVIDVDVNNTGADGLDWKDDSDAAVGNIVKRYSARNFGLSSQVLTAQVGLDLRSGVHAEDVNISEMTGISGLVGIRLQNGTPGAIPVQGSKISHFNIQGSNATDSNGLRCISRYCTASDGYVKGCTDGYSLTDPDTRFINLIAESNNVGFRLWQDTAAGVEADTVCLIGAIARSNTQAGIVYDSVDEVTVLGADVRNNGIGHDIRAGSTNIRIIAGSCSGNTTQISDAGTGTVVTSVSGLRTRQKIKADVLVDSTGTKTVTMTHNLGVTPDITDVQLTFARDPAFNVGDFTLGFYWVDSVSATQVICKARVTAASATAGAKINLIADINAKSTM